MGKNFISAFLNFGTEVSDGSVHIRLNFRGSKFFTNNKFSGALRTGSMAFEATLWQNLDQLYAK